MSPFVDAHHGGSVVPFRRGRFATLSRLHFTTSV